MTKDSFHIQAVGKFHGHGPMPPTKKGLKGRSRGPNFPKFQKKIGKIKISSFGPNMALLAIGTVTAGLAQFLCRLD